MTTPNADSSLSSGAASARGDLLPEDAEYVLRKLVGVSLVNGERRVTPIGLRDSRAKNGNQAVLFRDVLGANAVCSCCCLPTKRIAEWNLLQICEECWEVTSPTPSAAPVGLGDAVAWLVESAGSAPYLSHFAEEHNGAGFCWFPKWTADPNSALRFSRKKDAQKIAEAVGVPRAIATEHKWIGATPSRDTSSDAGKCPHCEDGVADAVPCGDGDVDLIRCDKCDGFGNIAPTAENAVVPIAERPMDVEPEYYESLPIIEARDERTIDVALRAFHDAIYPSSCGTRARLEIQLRAVLDACCATPPAPSPSGCIGGAALEAAQRVAPNPWRAAMAWTLDRLGGDAPVFFGNGATPTPDEASNEIYEMAQHLEERAKWPLIELLKEALSTLEGLAEQQAIPDDWWKTTQAKLKKEIGDG